MKFISLISSGIDSPVATYLLSKYVDELIFVHAEMTPFTDEREKEKFLAITDQLRKVISCPIKVYIVPHGSSLVFYRKYCKTRFTCIFCKRMLLRYGEYIAEKEHAEAIIMGDSLGQVASQTLYNIQVIDGSTYLPVLRPLIGLDKEEIVRIAKDIGTYSLSISPSTGCSAVPRKPSTKALLQTILAEEQKIDIQKLVSTAISNAIVFPS